MSAYFHLRNLTLTGTAKKPATITFENGLNVIAGASNTGKTFIFQCLDFMLGGQKPPKPIEESKGYERIHLVISTSEGEYYTILRSITGGAFQIKHGDINDNMPYGPYYEKLSNDPQNISTFLLTLCGLQDIQLKKNANNVKVRLSFRDVAGLCLVDEKTIISEDSPVYHSGESVTRTKEQSLFYYFLIGEDATAIAEIEDPKILKNKIAGKIELVEELIQTTQAKLEEFKGQNIEGLEKDLEAQYERLNLDYRTSINEIDQLRNQKVIYYRNIEKLESKKLFNKELLDRFELLDKHYISDRNRLEFISEGSFLLNQLNNVNCPICGSDMNESHFDHIEKFQTDNENFEISLGKELGKITLKQTELTQTITQLKEDNLKQQKAIAKVKAKIDEIDEKLNNSLTPVSLSLRARLQILSESKANLDRYKTLKSEVANYSEHLNGLNLLSKKKIETNEEAINLHIKSFNEFSKTVEGVLNDWQFPNITSLTFDTKYKEFDIRINNNPRSTNGKGYRAITYTAFLYGLMKYSLNKGRNHPGFMVFDSPLTTFKERDGAEEKIENVSQNVEFAFFDSLANDHLSQTIIFENKEPDISLIKKMYYIHFSGQQAIGRPGFFSAASST